MAEDTKPRRVPPDLQAFVAKYGRYDLISDTAWTNWDRENEDYKQAIRLDLPWPPED